MAQISFAVLFSGLLARNSRISAAVCGIANSRLSGCMAALYASMKRLACVWSLAAVRKFSMPVSSKTRLFIFEQFNYNQNYMPVKPYAQKNPPVFSDGNFYFFALITSRIPSPQEMFAVPSHSLLTPTGKVFVTSASCKGYLTPEMQTCSTRSVRASTERE